MYICRVFDRDHPLDEIATRLVVEGEITLGRDPAADWPLPDPQGTLSRIHCTLAVDGDRLTLRDRSTNGTFLDDGSRAPRDTPVPIAAPHRLHLGALTIEVDRTAPDPNRTDLCLPLPVAATEILADWPDAPPPYGQTRGASLIEAFCEGARLDASALSSEDPAELMRRVGAVYQQTVLGLAALMAERTRLKGQYQLDRTSIGASGNNPFKWAPSRRLAQDLLCASDSGFLSDAEAVRASFEDLSGHLAAIAGGARAAIQAVTDTLSPDAIAEEARGQGLSLRGRAATCWDIHARRHAGLTKPDGPREDAIARAFGEGYVRADQPPPR